MERFRTGGCDMKNFIFENSYTKEQSIIQMEDSMEFVGEQDTIVVRDNKVWFQLFNLCDGTKQQAKEGSKLYEDWMEAGYTFAADRYYLNN
jgi:hypothetical protein